MDQRRARVSSRASGQADDTARDCEPSGRRLLPTAIPIMSVELIHAILCLAFLAVWAMAGAIVVRQR